MTSTRPTDQRDAEAEAAVRQRLRRTVQGQQPDVEALLPAIVSSGRQIRRRRRWVAAAMAGGGLGLGAAVGVVGFQALTDEAGGQSVQVMPAQQPSTSTRAATPTMATQQTAPVPQPERPPAHRAAWRLDARTATYYLTALAPRTASFSDFQGQQSADRGSTAEVFAALAVDLGDGKVGLQVNVQADFATWKKSAKDGAAPGTTFFHCHGQERSDQGRVYCHDERLPDGTLLLEEEHRTGAVVTLSADLLRPDNTRVVVMTGNTRQLERSGSRHGHLTRAELRRIATSPLWNPYVKPSANVRDAARKTIRPFELLPG